MQFRWQSICAASWVISLSAKRSANQKLFCIATPWNWCYSCSFRFHNFPSSSDWCLGPSLGPAVTIVDYFHPSETDRGSCSGTLIIHSLSDTFIKRLSWTHLKCSRIQHIQQIWHRITKFILKEMLRTLEMRLQMYKNICHFRCRKPCRVRTTKGDLTDIEAVHWGGAEIKSSTRISEASDTLAWALWFSEERTAWLSLTLWIHTVAEEKKKKHTNCHNDTETRPTARPIWRPHLNYFLNQFLATIDW